MLTGISQEGSHPDPGLHCRETPYLRRELELLTSHMRTRDGKNHAGPAPKRFDYRSIDRDFTIWGWRVQVDRSPTEFLSLWDVTCTSVTLQGTGTVTVTVPRACRTGRAGERRFTVALGHSAPVETDDAAPVYAVTRTVALSKLRSG